MTESVDLDPGVDWPAAVGLSVAIAGAGLVALLAVAAGVSSDAVLGLVPTVFTGGLLYGAIVAHSRPDFALRLGAWRWRTIVCCLPALIVAGGFGLLAAVEIGVGDWSLPLVGIALVGIGLPGRLLALAAHDVSVGVKIDQQDESITAWMWYQSGTNIGILTLGIVLLTLATVLSLIRGQILIRLLFLAFGSIAIGWAPTLSVSRADGSNRVLLSVPDVEYSRADIRAYDVGIVVEPQFIPSYRRFVPWDRITDIRLTDERLVLERRWWPDIRCDQSAIEGCDGVLETLETITQDEQSPNHRLTSLE